MRARVLALALVVGCAPPLEEGRFSCNDDLECPDGWVCRDDDRCWSIPGPDGGAVDAGAADAGALDGGDLDGGALDGGLDAQVIADGGVDACVPRSVEVDVLVMVDQSASMERNQQLLAEAFPPLIRAIASGDFDGDSMRDVPQVESLHVGVITSDMGAHGNTVATCEGRGDDGILITESFGGAADCAPSYPSYLTYEVGDSTLAFEADFACLSAVGRLGCGFEQQLDAVLKSLTPAGSPFLFYGSEPGHGAGANEGFLREGSVLVVIVVSDEEDCSTHNADLFSTTEPYASTDFNRRCYEHADVLLPVSRYVDGLTALRADPRDLIVASVVGIPVARVDDMPSEILEDPAMTYTFVGGSNIPEPACRDLSASARTATPGRRYVELADGLVEEGANVVLRSICEPDFSGMTDDLLNVLAPRLEARACE